MPKSLDVVAIGNAIVDVIARVDDGFVAANGVERGAMTLIDAERGEALYAAMPPGIEVSGGSAGNTAAGLAALGSRAGYIRSEEHTSELQSLMRISYAVFCLKKKK